MRSTDAQHTDLGVPPADDQSVVRLRGEVDLSSAPPFRRCLLAACQRTRTDLVVDVSKVSFLDCAGLAVLAGIRDGLRAQDRALMLRGARGVVRRAIEMSDLAPLLEDRPVEAIVGRP